MEQNGKSMISQNWSIEDYLKLNLSENSTDDDWTSAIHFLEERFTERYFKVIKELSYAPADYGFAIMALNCLLIDAFYQFENGLEETNNNKACYTSFLKKHLPHLFPTDTQALLFYKHIRCGILHSAQTKSGSQLTYNKDYAVEFFNCETNIRVDVLNFSHELYGYFEHYITRLKDGDIKTRKAFLRKMQYLCRN